jgi:hypothetical protein
VGQALWHRPPSGRASGRLVRHRVLARLLTLYVCVTCYDRAEVSIPWADVARRSIVDRGREMATSETLSLHQQAERLQGWRDGFQAVYVVATGVQTGFFDQFAAHPQGLTAQELAQCTTCHAPFVAIWCASAYRYHPWTRSMDVMSWPHMWTVSWLDARIPIVRPCCSSMPSGRLDHVWRGMLTT